MAKKEITMHLATYLNQYFPDVHRYARSYLTALHNDRMKTKEEWDAEMRFHGLLKESDKE